MATFLNNFLQENRDMKSLDGDALKAAFSEACTIVLRVLGPDGLKYYGRLNAAHIDALLGVLMYLIGRNRAPDDKKLKVGIGSLRSDSKYSEWVSRSTSHRDSVLGRLETAYSALA